MQVRAFERYITLLQVKSIAECSNESILQYFRPSLSYHLSLRPLFCLFLSSHFIQVLLYLNLYIPVSIFSFMLGRVFLG